MPLIIVVALILGWPLAEIAMFIAVGSHIGILPTLMLSIGTSVGGVFLLKQQGLSMLRRIRTEMARGDVPSESVAHAGMIALGGVMLLLPGLLSDIIGLLLFLPPVRVLVMRLVGGRLKVRRATTSGGIRVIELERQDWQSSSRPFDPRQP